MLALTPGKCLYYAIWRNQVVGHCLGQQSHPKGRMDSAQLQTARLICFAAPLPRYGEIEVSLSPRKPQRIREDMRYSPKIRRLLCYRKGAMADYHNR